MQKEYVSLIEEYCSAIKNHFSDRLISICLFGSVARGEAKPDSDIDFLIVTHEYLKKINIHKEEKREAMETKNILKDRIEAVIKSGLYTDKDELYEEAIP